MFLVKPSYTIERLPENILATIESFGRVCYKSEDKIGSGTAEKFVRNIIKRGHESVIEHVAMSIRFIVDRGVSHEIVRHRFVSFSQESTRYCSYKGAVEFIIPNWVGIPEGEYNDISEAEKFSQKERIWLESLFSAENAYNKLLEEGCSPQDARAVLPNSLKTEIVCTANMREWRHVLKLRTGSGAHPQMKEIMKPLLKELKSGKETGVLFEDIENTD